MRTGWRMVIVATLLPGLQGILCGAGDSRDVILREADAAIQKNRKGTLLIEAAPNTEVTVEQVRHEFWFGAALASSAFGGGRMSPQDKEKYLSVFLENFNSAVTENALKWHSMEPRRGDVDYSVVDAILKWTEEHGDLEGDR